MKLFLFNLKTKKVSKKSWKTYKGAAKNASRTDIIVTEDGIDWCKRHPSWGDERLGMLK